MIAFRKVHGAGNDFILVADPRHVCDWGELATGFCHRRTGIGASSGVKSSGAAVERASSPVVSL
jgi:diaminopimelate epimerase